VFLTGELIMSEQKDYFYMMLRDVNINALALKPIRDFEPDCFEIEVMEELHDQIGNHFNLHMLSDSSLSMPSRNREDWIRLQREHPAIEPIGDSDE